MRQSYARNLQLRLALLTISLLRRLVYGGTNNSSAGRRYLGLLPLSVHNPALRVALCYVLPCLSFVARPQSSPDCVDERRQLIDEYMTYRVVDINNKQLFVPKCSDFTQTTRTRYFDFGDLTKKTPTSWALIREPLALPASSGYGLDKWQEAIGGALELSSVYRSPSYNKSLKKRGYKPAANSRHMFGDAVDVLNQSHTPHEYEALLTAARNAKASWWEPVDTLCALGCFHADWRQSPGPFVTNTFPATLTHLTKATNGQALPRLAKLPVAPVFEPVKVKVGVSTKSLVLEAKDVTHDIKIRKVEIEDGKDDFSAVQDPVDTAHTIEVSFKPQAAGVRTGKMLIQSNAEGSPHSIALQGEGREAIVRVDTNKLDFHSQKRKTHSDFLTWTIHNAGDVPMAGLRLQWGSAEHSAFTPDEGSLSLFRADNLAEVMPGGNITIRVRFSPESEGPHTAELKFTSDGEPHSIPATLTGIGTAPVLSSLPPMSTDFGVQKRNTTSKPKRWLVRNEGPAVMESMSLKLTGPQADAFSIVGPATTLLKRDNVTVLRAGEELPIDIIFSPTKSGLFLATLSLNTDANGQAEPIQFEGTGAVPVVSVSKDVVKFGSHQRKRPAFPQTVTLHNEGPVTLTISSISLADDVTHSFAVTATSGSPGKIEVPPGADLPVVVQFSPSTAGTKNARLCLTGDGEPATLYVSLTGRGTHFWRLW